ncbi:amidase signature domain-containing protein [Lasiosphaeria ovina]|uniref:Amidase signature domain-containing protein n=1 Tax=Lasiosphaeria ovina TaxID=92902 RepID=A0AAE0JZ85_9PEZI|nr:amidase signature domain-containing protein [Lasiosphaeria ovina]
MKYLNASTSEASPNLAIAVPSRLYYPPRLDKPLHGLRVAITDNIDIAGVRTYASSWAYGELYGPAPASAPSVQKLFELGAVIVGTTGMSQFAGAEDPTGDFVEFHTPWNPRGDGIRSSGGSSYGSGAATGAYDWLDFAIGTDSMFGLILFSYPAHTRITDKHEA